jgi:hypothetical protein
MKKRLPKLGQDAVEGELLGCRSEPGFANV